MRYEMLGPVRIVVNGEALSSVGTHKMEVLLRALLIRKDRVVSLEQLTRELWGESPPVRAVASLHVYVSQLRKVLNKFSLSDEVIQTRAPGYVLNLERDELDLDVFLAMMDKARVQVRVNSHADAAEILTGALSLWKEPIHASCYEGPIIREFATWSEEIRVECVELLARSLLTSDQASEAIRILYSLVSEYPLRERSYALLMEALSVAGRRADALDVYRAARRLIRAELGLEPCRLLKETQERILNDRIEVLSVVRVRGAHADGRD